MQIKQCIILFLSFSTLCYTQQPFTIMIDPSGDAKHPGRLIEDTLERGISLQCAEALKKSLTDAYKNLRVVLTRIPGETIKPLQNASFANRLDIDLYVSIYCYHEQENPSHITLYHYLSDPITDAWHKPQKLCFYRVDQAHLMNLATTQTWGKLFTTSLEKTSASKFFKIRGLYGIPFKPLIGIQAPALALEVGLHYKQDWKHLISPIVNALESIIS